MSLPNEILDSLLSGYLDDALTADERARVEQLLESDADVRSELDSMRELREVLQHIDRVDRRKAVAMIRPSFSEQVIDAAIECARDEGVSEDHPLLRSTEAPSYRRDQSKRSRRLAVAVAALAASGLIGAIVLRPAYNATTPIQVAQQTESLQSPDEPVVAEANVAGPMVASVEGTVEATVEAVAEAVAPQPSVDRVHDMVASNATVMKASPAVERMPSEAQLSEAQPSETQPMIASDAGKANLDPALAELLVSSPVFVFDVRVSESGRSEHAISNALRQAAIAPVSQRAVSDAMVSSVSKAVRALQSEADANAASSASEIAGRVIYIEASAKKIDRLMSALWADNEGIESFRFNMSLDAPLPLKNVVDSLSSLRATDIQHDQTVEFNGELASVSGPLATYLGNGNFREPNQSRAAAAASTVEPIADDRNEDANDFMSRVFLIVR